MSKTKYSATLPTHAETARKKIIAFYSGSPFFRVEKWICSYRDWELFKISEEFGYKIFAYTDNAGGAGKEAFCEINQSSIRYDVFKYLDARDDEIELMYNCENYLFNPLKQGEDD